VNPRERRGRRCRHAERPTGSAGRASAGDPQPPPGSVRRGAASPFLVAVGPEGSASQQCKAPRNSQFGMGIKKKRGGKESKKRPPRGVSPAEGTRHGTARRKTTIYAESEP